MNYANPNPRTFVELEALLDSRVSKLPNPAMTGFNIRKEARRIATDMETIERFSGED